MAVGCSPIISIATKRRYTKDERSVRKEERILAEEKGGGRGGEGEGNTTPEERGGADR